MSKKVAKRKNVEVVSMDELALYQDNDLYARHQFLDNELHACGLRHGDFGAVPYEVEQAYVEREVGIRNERKRLHQAYLASLETEYVDESSLPSYEPTTPVWN